MNQVTPNDNDASNLHELPITFERMGVVLQPNGAETESEGVLNPASTRDRDGNLLLYPRMVAPGNISRIGLVVVDEALPDARYLRQGFVLEPEADYELRTASGGYGCEDPRVTFIEVLDAYIMAYVAYGPEGPRIALALSGNGYTWERLGLMEFATNLPQGADKDAAFFPSPVQSPSGVASLAFYHRPMSLTAPPITPVAAAAAILELPPNQREGIRIGYIPLEAVLRDIRNIRTVTESVPVIAPNPQWGRIKIGAGTPPIRINEAWFSLYHGVDVIANPASGMNEVTYSVAAVLHDLQRPHVIQYLSPEPIWFPANAEELYGTVDNVVFPTAIEKSPGQPNAYDVYYGMADSRVGKMRLSFAARR